MFLVVVRRQILTFYCNFAKYFILFQMPVSVVNVYTQISEFPRHLELEFLAEKRAEISDGRKKKKENDCRNDIIHAAIHRIQKLLYVGLYHLHSRTGSFAEYETRKMSHSCCAIKWISSVRYHADKAADIIASEESIVIDTVE